jgi:hypothetical protein
MAFWVRMLVVLGLLLAAGCQDMLYPRFDKKMWATYIDLNEVSLGMSRSQVEGVMGPPAIKEEGDYRTGRYTFYFYLTHDMDQEGSGTVRGGYTPLVFKDNRLVGIGKRAYNLATEQTTYTEDYPNLPWRAIK